MGSTESKTHAFTAPSIRGWEVTRKIQEVILHVPDVPLDYYLRATESTFGQALHFATVSLHHRQPVCDRCLDLKRYCRAAGIFANVLQVTAAERLRQENPEGLWAAMMHLLGKATKSPMSLTVRSRQSPYGLCFWTLQGGQPSSVLQSCRYGFARGTMEA